MNTDKRREQQRRYARSRKGRESNSRAVTRYRTTAKGVIARSRGNLLRRIRRLDVQEN